jgi:hypothetical protein
LSADLQPARQQALPQLQQAAAHLLERQQQQQHHHQPDLIPPQHQHQHQQNATNSPAAGAQQLEPQADVQEVYGLATPRNQSQQQQQQQQQQELPEQPHQQDPKASSTGKTSSEGTHTGTSSSSSRDSRPDTLEETHATVLQQLSVAQEKHQEAALNVTRKHHSALGDTHTLLSSCITHVAADWSSVPSDPSCAAW